MTDEEKEAQKRRIRERLERTDPIIEDAELVVCCYVCGEPGNQPDDPGWLETGGVHPRCREEHERTGKICM